jgi:hypothetical protein
MKLYAGVKVQLHISSIQHKVDVNDQLHTPATLPQIKQLTVTVVVVPVIRRSWFVNCSARPIRSK